MLAKRLAHFGSWSHWLRLGLLALAVISSLAWGQAAYAQVGYSTITLYAPAAPAAAYTVVQYQTPDGTWHNVDGWQGALDTLEDPNLQLKQWSVAPENSGQGPFRWVIYTSQGGAVWGVSESFTLPSGDGADLAMTVEAATSTTGTAEADTIAPVATASAAPGVATDVTTDLPRVTTDESTWHIDCAEDCDYAQITVFLPDAPAGSSVGVQYQAADGAWRNVEGWQGTAWTDDNGLQFMSWTVFPENYHQEPFRWVVTDPTGAIWGVGAEFRLPGQGANYIRFLLRH